MRKLLYLLPALGLLGTGCNKDKQTDTPEPPGEVDAFLEMEVPDGFEWRTTKAVTIQINGSEGAADVRRPLDIIAPSGELLQRRMTRVSEDLTIKMELPKTMEDVEVRYGTLAKSLDIRSGNAAFDYEQSDDRSDLHPADR